MAREKGYWESRDKSAGDIAVDGLLAGLLSGVIMGVFLVAAEWLAGIGPVETLSRFNPGVPPSPMVGGLLHLALSGLYGVVFALLFRMLVSIRPSLGRWGWLLGAAYGVVLWSVAQALLVTGFNEALGTLPSVLFVLAHVLYGSVLGMLLSRMERAV